MRRYTKQVAGLTVVVALVWLTSAGAAPPLKSDNANPNAAGQQEGGGAQDKQENGNGNQQSQGNGNQQTSAPKNGSGTTGATGPSGPSSDDPAPAPEDGKSVTVQPGHGTVMVKLPGSSKAVQLTGGDSIPVGAQIDTRHGQVQLTSAIGSSGTTQTGTFWGGVFTVKQSRSAGGYTELDLVGGRPASCSSTRRATVARRRNSGSGGGKLWGHDHHGHFRTRGQNSVATVRGTRWLTLETCKGTVTRVSQGAVSVHDLRAHKTVLVKAHHSYIARRHRAG